MKAHFQSLKGKTIRCFGEDRLVWMSEQEPSYPVEESPESTRGRLAELKKQVSQNEELQDQSDQETIKYFESVRQELMELKNVSDFENFLSYQNYPLTEQNGLYSLKDYPLFHAPKDQDGNLMHLEIYRYEIIDGEINAVSKSRRNVDSNGTFSQVENEAQEQREAPEDVEEKRMIDAGNTVGEDMQWAFLNEQEVLSAIKRNPPKLNGESPISFDESELILEYPNNNIVIIDLRGSSQMKPEAMGDIMNFTLKSTPDGETVFRAIEEAEGMKEKIVTKSNGKKAVLGNSRLFSEFDTIETQKDARGNPRYFVILNNGQVTITENGLKPIAFVLKSGKSVTELPGMARYQVDSSGQRKWVITKDSRERNFSLSRKHWQQYNNWNEE